MKKTKKTIIGLFVVIALVMLGCLSAPAVNEGSAQSTDDDSYGLARMWTWKADNDSIVLVFDKKSVEEDAFHEEEGEYGFVATISVVETIYTGTYSFIGQTIIMMPSSGGGGGPLDFYHYNEAPFELFIENDSLALETFTFHKGLWYENTPGTEEYLAQQRQHQQQREQQQREQRERDLPAHR